jgi:hypothetical protein
MTIEPYNYAGDTNRREYAKQFIQTGSTAQREYNVNGMRPTNSVFGLASSHGGIGLVAHIFIGAGAEWNGRILQSCIIG